MENFGEKINDFSALVLQDANEKRDRLMSRVEEKYKSIMDAKENEYLQEAYEKIQRSISQSRKEANERLLHVEMDSKRKLLLKREEIINEVMDEVRSRVSEFKNTPQYEEWLKKRVSMALFEVGKGTKTVYIASDDLKYKEMIESIPDTSKIIVEAAADRHFLGGIKVYNLDRRVSVDYSFKEMLAEEKQEFLQSSGLSIG